MLAVNIHLRAEENLGHISVCFLKRRLYELANDRDFQLPHQVSHENEAVFQHAHQVYGSPLEVGRYLASHLLDTFSDLLCRKQYARGFLRYFSSDQFSASEPRFLSLQSQFPARPELHKPPDRKSHASKRSRLHFQLPATPCVQRRKSHVPVAQAAAAP